MGAEGLFMISTVIFDMDDTLYDEVDYCKSGFSAVGDFLAELKGMNSDSVFECLWGEFMGGNRQKTFNTALEKLGIEYDDGFIGKLVSVYREHEPTITLPAESKAGLDEFKGKYHLALLTDGFMPAQRLKAEALGIEGYFECIVYTELLGREFWKPAVEGFLEIVKALGESAENCVYVGDNAEKDFIGPNRLGFETVQIVRPNGIHNGVPPEGLEEAAAGCVIDSIGELEGVLGGL